MIWIKYLLEANLYMALFYAMYYLILRRDTHYQLSRVYLLATTLLAFVIPFFELGILKPTIAIIEPIITPRAAQPTGIPNYPIFINSAPLKPGPAEPVNYYLWVYIVVGALMAISLIYRLAQLMRLARKGHTEKAGKISLIKLDEDDHAFSFFNYLFISSKLASMDTIIRHEMVHIRQKHSWDIIYIELLKIVCWFNPTVYFIQHSIKELHEYIVDRTIASEKDDVDRYTDFLIQNAYGLPAIAPANNFFTKNLLKNRIMMLHQKRSGSLARLKYLVALPLSGGMLCLSTLGFTKDHPVYDIAPKAVAINNATGGPTAPEQTKDTLPKPPKPKVDQVRFPPKPPKPKVDQVRFPPPMVLKDGYLDLRNFMQRNTAYPKAAVDKKLGGSVTLAFNLDAAGMIADVKIVKSVGSGLDEEGIRLLKAYKKPITDKEGQHTIALNFVTKGIKDHERASEATMKAPGFVGEVLIFSKNYPMFPPPIVKPDPAKKVSIRRLSSPITIAGVKSDNFLQPTSPLYVIDGVVVTAQNAASLGLSATNASSESPLSQIPQEHIASLEILKDAAAISTYGDAGRYGVILITTHHEKAKKQGANINIDQNTLDQFGKDIERIIKYPAAARENGVTGKVFVVFNIDNDSKINNLKILRGLSDEVNTEVIRALKSWKAPESFPKDVNFLFPLSFDLKSDANDNVVISAVTYENKVAAPPYYKTGFKEYSLPETVVRGYVRRTR